MIHINIWDDYYEDGFVPEGEIQETYMYVDESNRSEEDTKKILEKVLGYISFDMLSDAKFELIFHDSAFKYPNLIGTEYEWMLYKRWEISIKHLSHNQLNNLVDDLNEAELSLNEELIVFYSES